MQKDSIKGAAKDIAGSTKEGLGKALKNDKMVAEGLAERGEGKALKASGAAKDAAHKAIKH